MYGINEMVLHPNAGVCEVVDIKNEKFGGEVKKYYILKPVYDNNSTTLFVPVDGFAQKLQKIISAQDIDALITSVPDNDPVWIDDDRARQDRFAGILRDGNRVEVIRMIIDINDKRRERHLSGKKLRVADEVALRKAEKLIQQEFAYALNLRVEDVAPFVMSRLGIDVEATD